MKIHTNFSNNISALKDNVATFMLGFIDLTWSDDKRAVKSGSFEEQVLGVVNNNIPEPYQVSSIGLRSSKSFYEIEVDLTNVMENEASASDIDTFRQNLISSITSKAILEKDENERYVPTLDPETIGNQETTEVYISTDTPHGESESGQFSTIVMNGNSTPLKQVHHIDNSKIASALEVVPDGATSKLNITIKSDELDLEWAYAGLQSDNTATVKYSTKQGLVTSETKSLDDIKGAISNGVYTVTYDDGGNIYPTKADGTPEDLIISFELANESVRYDIPTIPTTAGLPS